MSISAAPHQYSEELPEARKRVLKQPAPELQL